MNPLPSTHAERFVTFECEGARCIGVVSEALPARNGRLGVLVVVGGPQYRVGSHRQFALLARALADAGIPVLRFDYRGMGDSDGEPRTFEDIDADLRAAADALCRETGVAHVVLWGLCDAASAALMFAAQDRRVAGIVALNPWARSPQGEASTRLRHYYLKRLLAPELWRKIVTGRFRAGAAAADLAAVARKAVGSATAPTAFLDRMETGWLKFANPILFVLSGRDLTAREFEAWAAADPHRRARLDESRVLSFPRADHTFSDRASRDAVAAATIEWIAGLDDAR